MMISSPASATNCRTGVVCGIGWTPAVPPPCTGDFCCMFCAPASIVCRTPLVVARCRIVTAARNGSRRYFQFANGRSSSWLAVRARDQEKSGIFPRLHVVVTDLVAVDTAPPAARAELVLLVLHALRAVDAPMRLQSGHRDPP